MRAVRTANRHDARAVASVHVRAWRIAYRGLVSDELLEVLSVDERERIWRKLLGDTHDPSFTLVAVDAQNRVEGFCSVAAPSRDQDAGEGTAEIAATYVDPERWREGVGSALFEAARAELRRAGWKEATLWVFARNDQAQAFYAVLGFKADGATMKHERSGQDVIRMCASLVN